MSDMIVVDRKELEELKRIIEDQINALRRWQHDENQIGTHYRLKELKAENEKLRSEIKKLRFIINARDLVANGSS